MESNKGFFRGSITIPDIKPRVSQAEFTMAFGLIDVTWASWFGAGSWLCYIPSRERSHIPPNGKRKIIDSKVTFHGIC